jgi:hypothetical protein
MFPCIKEIRMLIQWKKKSSRQYFFMTGATKQKQSDAKKNWQKLKHR